MGSILGFVVVVLGIVAILFLCRRFFTKRKNLALTSKDSTKNYGTLKPTLQSPSPVQNPEGVSILITPPTPISKEEFVHA